MSKRPHDDVDKTEEDLNQQFYTGGIGRRRMEVAINMKGLGLRSSIVLPMPVFLKSPYAGTLTVFLNTLSHMVQVFFSCPRASNRLRAGWLSIGRSWVRWTGWAGSNASGAGGGIDVRVTCTTPMTYGMMGLFATVAWNSRSRLCGPTTGSGASYLSGVFSAVHSAKAAENSQRFLGTCAAPLLRLCQNHGCRDARKKQTTHIFVAIRAQAFRPWYM